MCVYTVPLTFLFPGVRGSDLHSWCWHARERSSMCSSSPCQYLLGSKCWTSHTRSPCPLCCLWNEADKGPQLPDSPESCDSPPAGLGKHMPCKSSSTKMIYSHRHPARSVTVKRYFIRSRNYSWFKEIVS